MIRASCIINYKHIASFALKSPPKVGSPFNYNNKKGTYVKNGKVTQVVLTVFDYVDANKLTAIPIYNVVIQSEDYHVGELPETLGL